LGSATAAANRREEARGLGFGRRRGWRGRSRGFSLGRSLLALLALLRDWRRGGRAVPGIHGLRGRRLLRRRLLVLQLLVLGRGRLLLGGRLHVLLRRRRLESGLGGGKVSARERTKIILKKQNETTLSTRSTLSLGIRDRFTRLDRGGRGSLRGCFDRVVCVVSS
jgi:hypothetical protein